MLTTHYPLPTTHYSVITTHIKRVVYRQEEGVSAPHVEHDLPLVCGGEMIEYSGPAVVTEVVQSGPADQCDVSCVSSRAHFLLLQQFTRRDVLGECCILSADWKQRLQDRVDDEHLLLLASVGVEVDVPLEGSRVVEIQPG